MNTLPTKLKDDFIVEALCQIQFVSDDLAEVVVGRATDYWGKKGYVAERLPIADIPAPIRQADPNLRFQPTIQLRAKQGPNLIRIGEQAISFHIAGEKQYPGWNNFREQLRLAHGSFVQGTLPARTSAVIDVEVSTTNEFLVKNADDVMVWIEKAHTFEKGAFFALIPNAIQQKLVEP